MSKNDRAGRLFSALADIRSDYLDLGICKARKALKYLSAGLSFQTSREQWYTDTMFSPLIAREMERQGSILLRGQPQAQAILYWGAMNRPALPHDLRLPYFVVTDGPFDPEDRSYPIEWSPRRWRAEYVRRQGRIFREARHVFTLTDWAREKILRLHAIDANRVTRIGWGPIQQATYVNEHPAQPGFFLSAGTEWYRKGMDIVAKAGAAFHTRYPESTTLIVGRPRGFKVPQEAGVVQIPEGLPGEALQILMAQARALIVASRFDASPHVIYEALQVGTPVIGTKVCGIPEALIDTRCGLSVPAGDEDALVAAMEQIWQAEPRMQRRAARAGYEEEGGWMKAAQIVDQVIQTSLN